MEHPTNAASKNPTFTAAAAAAAATTTGTTIPTTIPTAVAKTAGTPGTRDTTNNPPAASFSRPSSSSSVPLASSVVLLLRDWGQYGLVDRVGYHARLLLLLQQDPDSQQQQHDPQNNDAASRPTPLLPSNNSDSSNSGVVALLECVPTQPWHKLTKRQRYEWKQAVQQASALCSTHSTQERCCCCEPPTLPPLSSHSRLFFCYEVTRMALVLDASPTLTATFGHGQQHHASLLNSSSSSEDGGANVSGSSSCCCCPMDRFLQMSATFWNALCQPIPTTAMSAPFASNPTNNSNTTFWQPEIAVTVLAVFPRRRRSSTQSNHKQQPQEQSTSILVRDFLVSDAASAHRLVQNIQTWCHLQVEPEIARRMAHSSSSSSSLPPTTPLSDRDEKKSEAFSYTEPTGFALPQQHQLYEESTSRHDDLLTAGLAAVSTLSSAARPCIVLATDCRTAALVHHSGGDWDMAQKDPALRDVPISVLDLSPPIVRSMLPQQPDHEFSPPPPKATATTSNPTTFSNFSLLNYDPDGGSFPMHLSDTECAEGLYNICRATGGVFFNESLLNQAASIKAGQGSKASSPQSSSGSSSRVSSTIHSDFFFSFRRHDIQPNAVQWYMLFSLSQLTPIVHDTWGSLAQPKCLATRFLQNRTESRSDSATSARLGNSIPAYDAIGNTRNITESSISSQRKHTRARTTVATYFINPIHLQEIILLRVKQGYRTKQCSFNSIGEPDYRVSIQFFLPVDFDTVITYELSYQARPDSLVHGVGFASIKIELVGDSSFITMVKNDFIHGLSQSISWGHPATKTQQISEQLRSHLSNIRKDDLLQSYLCPLKWSDQLISSETPFVRRLGSMSSFQRRKHFSVDEFDCICIGRMPWDEDDFLSEFRDTDLGSNQLTDAVEKWSTQTIVKQKYYVRQTNPVFGVAGYCSVEIVPSPVASRLYTIVLETFDSLGANSRHVLLRSLKGILSSIKSIKVLPRQIGCYLVGETVLQRRTSTNRFFQEVLESHHNHVSWDLFQDAELLPLLMRRRREIGKFYLLHSNETSAFFAKLYDSDLSDSNRDPGNLAQYQIVVLKDKVVVDFHMESESATFFPFRTLRSDQPQTKFQQLLLSLKTRDQECGHALRCRTALLLALNDQSLVDYHDIHARSLSFLSCIQRLMGYASKVAVPLRFFQPGSGSANDILMSLTREMILSQAFNVRVAQLQIPIDSSIDGITSGDWFVVEYDKYTMSILHLSNIDKKHVSPIESTHHFTRELSLFTISVSDLYSRRDDLVDDSAVDDDHISEHLQVTALIDSWSASHVENYSLAAYRYLRLNRGTSLGEIDSGDFAEVVNTSTLEFIEVASAIVTGNWLGPGNDANNLSSLFQSVLNPISCDEHCLFYEKSAINPFLEDEFNLLLDDEDAEESVDSGSEGEGSLASIGSDEIKSSTASSFLELDHPRHVDAPIFAQILIDGRLATSDDLNNIQNSTKLATRLSVFKGHGSTRPLQSSHQAAASDLKRLLNAYSAEQTLERLRHRGLSLQESDVRLAMSCLRKARNGERVVVHVSFYVAKVDAMVAASSHVGAVIEIDEAFSLLGSEFRNSSNLPLRQLYSPDNFLLEKLDMSYASLDCFCFVKVHRVEGVVTVDMNHLGGWEKSSMLMDLVCDEISLCVHKVNQFLLLQALHSGRSASRLLISSDLKDSVDTFNRAVVNPFHEGVFFCPIVYKNSFELYHRCAAHPIHVIRLLEASVLHIFSVNNRRGVFVYKDESGAVFYMSLLPVQSDVGESTSVDHSAQIELVVHGISAPGPSIALQLRTLLQKRLLHISIEMFSSVLTKNPQYHWRQLDINFVRSFNNEWDKLIESDNIPRHINESRKYAFPLSAYDPGMITLFFRQNLCGSTFFHPLSTAESGKEANDCDDDNSNQKDTGNLHFDSSDLVFYYNASPSTLDPDFQSESTLTEKGALYSREAGAGIAIVTISLVCNAGKRKHDVSAAIPPPNVARALIVPTEKLRFLNANEATFLDQSDDDSDSFVEVTICDTCLQCATLHEWILLSMTQALVAWVLERHLERMQLSMFAVEGAGSSRTTNTTSTEQSRLREIDDICCGLPALHSILETSHQLPHPAVLKREYGGVFRSSSVAHIALDLLEKGIIDQIRNESKVQLVKDKHYRLFIVRSSRSEKPGLVELERATDGSVRVRCSQVKGGVEFLQDSPIDCPEYTILLFSSDFADDTSFVTKKTFPKLFEEVSVGYANSGVKGNYAKSLFRFKRQHLRFFRRSFAFIFTVKRNRRCLLAYNWSTSLFNRTTLKLQELERSFLISMSDSVASFQQRCLGNLSPTLLATNREKISGSGKDKEIRVWSEGPVTAGQGDRLDLNQPQSSQSSTHPHLMRRPKLVGKSVEGSAAQAVARSRARASVSRFRSTSSNSSAVAPRPPSGAHKSVRSPSPNIAVRKTSELPLPLQASSIDATEDRTLTNVRRYVDMIEQRTRLTHQSSVRAHTSLMLAAAHWPSKLSRGVSISVAQYLTSYGVFVWSEVYPMLPYPKKQLGSFSLTLGQTLSTLTPGLVPIPMIGQCAGDSCILAGKPRIIRNCQAFVVVNLSAKECFVNEKPVIIVKSEGRVLTLPLRRKKCHDKKCQSMNEYIAAAFDKLASDLRALVRLQSKLFDHSASLIEWTMKSGKTEDFGEVHWILTRLIESYPRITITKALRSNYKCFEATLLLCSYRDDLIDLFDGPTLFNWLSYNAAQRRLQKCGGIDGGLYFTTEIVVSGTQSVCFLSCDRQNSDKLRLSILSRSQGKDLHGFVFKPGSIVAMTIMAHIAVEAATLVYEELRFASVSLRQKSIWTLLSSHQTPSPSAAQSAFFSSPEASLAALGIELLSLCSVYPILSYLNAEHDNIQSIFRNVPSILHPLRCCQYMQQDSTFSPCWDWEVPANSKSDLSPLSHHQFLFYLDSANMFLCITVIDGQDWNVDLVQQGPLHSTLVSNDKQHSSAFPVAHSTKGAVAKVVNFILHSLWSDVANL